MLRSPASTEGNFLYEPKWDGFRAIVYRGTGEHLYTQSRELKPLDRYVPELHDGLVAQLPEGTVLDGEIVIVTDHGLDFEGGSVSAMAASMGSIGGGIGYRDGPGMTAVSGE